MTLRAGSRLGPFEILAPLGAGGMGEVYRARDTRLGREVAIKVLPSELAADSQRLKRFEKEAHSTSALNHPNIVTIHEVARADSITYIVMELVSGKTLRELLAPGPLPVRRVLSIGAEAAEGLAKAHAAGIVHRDLKPENLMVTEDGHVKILDFGLAKLTQPEPPEAEASHAPTVSKGTEPGVVMGTVGYMSPEQASGLPLDFRSDQFSFGSVLYELVTGRPAFEKKTRPETLAAIIREEPEPITALAPKTPAPLRWLVERCLAKEPRERYASTEDLARDLENLRGRLTETSGSGETAPVPPARRGLRVAPAILALATAAALVLGIALGFLRGRHSAAPIRRFEASLNPPAGTSYNLDAGIAVSPDGTHLVFSTDDNRMWVQDLSQASPRELPEARSGGPQSPFWSPDGRSVAFFAHGKLRVIDLSGGSTRVICDAPGGRGGSWSRDGTIVFAPGPYGPLFRVPASGGEPVPATALDPVRKDASHRWPWFLPDGRHFLYLAAPAGLSRQKFPWIVVGSVDSKDARPLAPAVSGPAYAPPGNLVYVRPGGTLVSQPFDEESLKTTGPAVPIAEGIEVEAARWNSPVGLSLTGLLAFRSGPSDSFRLRWFDRAGREEVAALGPAGEIVASSLSPDGQRAAVAVIDPQTGNQSTWIYDLLRGTAAPWTSEPLDEEWPIWSSDGHEIAFGSYRDGPRRNLFIGSSDGTAPARLLLDAPNEKLPMHLSSDGKWLVYADLDPKTKDNIWILPLFGDRKPRPFLKTDSSEGAARFSPDVRWLAYESNQSGRFEIFVTPFPGPGEKTQVSTAGGRDPRWSKRGGEIVFLAGDSQLMSVEIDTHGSPRAGVPKPLFQMPPGTLDYAYEVSPDSQRFLLVVHNRDFKPPPLTVVVNWAAGLREK